MVRLDAVEPTLDNWPTIAGDFGELQKLVAAESHDTMIRWMLAVACRQWNHNAIGAEQYRQILARWKPGPRWPTKLTPICSTTSSRYDEALAERRIAVRQEPSHWTYAGLANTLSNVGRFQEATSATHRP